MGPRQSLGARRVVPPRCAPWPQELFLAPPVPRWVGALLANYTLHIDQNSRQAYRMVIVRVRGTNDPTRAVSETIVDNVPCIDWNSLR